MQGRVSGGVPGIDIRARLDQGDKQVRLPNRGRSCVQRSPAIRAPGVRVCAGFETARYLFGGGVPEEVRRAPARAVHLAGGGHRAEEEDGCARNESLHRFALAWFHKPPRSGRCTPSAGCVRFSMVIDIRHTVVVCNRPRILRAERFRAARLHRRGHRAAENAGVGLDDHDTAVTRKARAKRPGPHSVEPFRDDLTASIANVLETIGRFPTG